MKPEETFKTKQDLETVSELRVYLTNARSLVELLSQKNAPRDVYAILYKIDEALLWSNKYKGDLKDKLSVPTKAEG